MAKDKKKDKEAKKLRAAEKAKKSAAKGEKKQKKVAAKQGEDEDDLDIDTILANYKKEQEAHDKVTVTNVDRPSKRVSCAMCASPVHGKKELFVFGGEVSNQSGTCAFFNDLFSYNINTDQWKKIESGNTPLPRSGHQMITHPSGIILMFGGEFSSPKQNTFYHYGDTWLFDAETREWSKLDQKKGPSARSGHRLTYWKNYILMHGGFRDLSQSTTYLDDLWAFDVTTYKWTQIEFPPNHQTPDSRSGHSFVPSPEGPVIFGGYSKVKHKGKKAVVGKVHQDVWHLKMKADIKASRWERRKKGQYAPSPRVGASLVHHRGRGVMFGGVFDTDETEESLDSTFYNQLYAYQIESNRWFGLSLRSAKKRKAALERAQISRDDDLKATLEGIFKDKLDLENAESEDIVADSAEIPADVDSDGEEIVQKEYPMANQLPHPRFNASMTVCDDVLYVFGGSWERGDREFTLDSFYGIDLNKLDGVKVFWEDLRELEEADVDSDEEDDEDDFEYEDEGEDEDEEGDVAMEDEEEEEEEEEISNETIPDPRPWLPHPKPFEVLRAFYARTADKFLEWALSADREARGKDLKKVAFDLAEDRFWERREEVRVMEDHFEEIGGVAEVVERDVRSGKTRR